MNQTDVRLEQRQSRNDAGGAGMPNGCGDQGKLEAAFSVWKMRRHLDDNMQKTRQGGGFVA